jgi:GntR family transcriptional regulator, vanillate catabolism transcriptional regulator
MAEKTVAATLSAELAERIRQDVLDGVIAPGSRINEVLLSRQLNVSRTPLRAALQTLAGEGLLDYTPNRGFTARAFPLSEVVDAYEMRALAEGLAARFAAERGLSSEACVELENALVLGDRILSTEGELNAQRSEYASVNEIFHSVIHDAANSRLIADVLRLCQRIPQASAHNILAFDRDDIRERHRLHHRIYDAILAREPREAENLMRQHVISVKASMVRAASRRLSTGAVETESAQRRATLAKEQH